MKWLKKHWKKVKKKTMIEVKIHYIIKLIIDSIIFLFIMYLKYLNAK